MAKTTQVPWYVPVGNTLTRTLLRAGFKLVGPGVVVGRYPMYLLTVRGRKSGLPRTVPVAIIARPGKRFVCAPYGVVDWVRNLRAAGGAILTRGRRSEKVGARELARSEAVALLREEVLANNPFVCRYMDLSANSTPEEYDRAAASHPVFLLESAAEAG